MFEEVEVVLPGRFNARDLPMLPAFCNSESSSCSITIANWMYLHWSRKSYIFIKKRRGGECD